MIMYRPVGLEELLLVYRSGMRRFPPRLPEQPFFYPVFSERYAAEIAQGWNATSGLMAGYVTEFELDEPYGHSFEVHQVGAREHKELWIPAESLDEFNSHILRQIGLVAAFFGPGFMGLSTAFSLRGKDARSQLEALREIHTFNLMDFHGEITANHEAVFAHFPYWEQLASEGGAALKVILPAIRNVWSSAFPVVRLGLQPPMSKPQ